MGRCKKANFRLQKSNANIIKCTYYVNLFESWIIYYIALLEITQGILKFNQNILGHILNIKCIQWPEMEIIWIFWNLHGKIREIKSSEFIFGGRALGKGY